MQRTTTREAEAIDFLVKNLSAQYEVKTLNHKSIAVKDMFEEQTYHVYAFTSPEVPENTENRSPKSLEGITNQISELKEDYKYRDERLVIVPVDTPAAERAVMDIPIYVDQRKVKEDFGNTTDILTAIEISPLRESTAVRTNYAKQLSMHYNTTDERFRFEQIKNIKDEVDGGVFSVYKRIEDLNLEKNPTSLGIYPSSDLEYNTGMILPYHTDPNEL